MMLSSTEVCVCVCKEGQRRGNISDQEKVCPQDGVTLPTPHQNKDTSADPPLRQFHHNWLPGLHRAGMGRDVIHFSPDPD